MHVIQTYICSPILRVPIEERLTLRMCPHMIIKNRRTLVECLKILTFDLFLCIKQLYSLCMCVYIFIYGKLINSRTFCVLNSIVTLFFQTKKNGENSNIISSFSKVCYCIHDSNLNFTVGSQQWNSSSVFHDFNNWITVKPWNREIVKSFFSLNALGIQNFSSFYGCKAWNYTSFRRFSQFLKIKSQLS